MRTLILAAFVALAPFVARADAFSDALNTPVPQASPAPPTYACAVHGQWYQTVNPVQTANGQDTYTGTGGDCTAFSISVPTGTAACKALGTACPLTTIAPLDFMARLTPAEQNAIATAGQSNAQVLLFLLKLSGAVQVDVTDPLTIAGTNAMVGAGLLTSARAAQIMDLTKSSP